MSPRDSDHKDASSGKEIASNTCKKIGTGMRYEQMAFQPNSRGPVWISNGVMGVETASSSESSGCLARICMSHDVTEKKSLPKMEKKKQLKKSATLKMKLPVFSSSHGPGRST